LPSALCAIRSVWRMSCRLRSRAATDSYEQAAFAAQTRHPADLRQPCFDGPIIRTGGEQVLRLLAHQKAGIGAEIVDAGLREPAAYFRRGVTMLFGMAILVADPG